MARTQFETGPEKVVIIAGPSFGQAVKFMLLGAAVGAGGVYYLLRSGGDASPAAKAASLKSVAAKYDAAVEDFTAENSGGDTTSEVMERVTVLASRLKGLGSRAKHLVEVASESVKPTLESAIAEGKKAAAEVQSILKKDVAEAGDGPAIAEQDGDLPSEKEDKFVE